MLLATQPQPQPCQPSSLLMSPSCDAPPVECSTEPLLVPMTLHAENRARLLARFKSGGDGGSAEAVPSQSVILMEGGKATTRDDTGE